MAGRGLGGCDRGSGIEDPRRRGEDPRRATVPAPRRHRDLGDRVGGSGRRLGRGISSFSWESERGAYARSRAAVPGVAPVTLHGEPGWNLPSAAAGGPSGQRGARVGGLPASRGLLPGRFPVELGSRRPAVAGRSPDPAPPPPQAAASRRRSGRRPRPSWRGTRAARVSGGTVEKLASGAGQLDVARGGGQ